MYSINKITSDHVVDFAAEELKKYLRMMMPRCGEIAIKYDRGATSGFRLGLMQDLGLDTSESDDTTLDDIIHIDTTEEGGILAGSNPRSVLLAVYKYLTLNGCRWLFPGVDGEFIPITEVKPTSYHKMADCRYRGQCNEGAEAQHLMMDEIDFTPKIGMNIFMIEFDNPKVYYDWYYDHRYNDDNRPPEPVDADTTLQWKRQCEAELSKRGLQFHDIGHGWTMESFGIDTTAGWVANDKNPIPEESREFVAMVNGKRELYGGVALNTNFCMSNPEARRRVVKKVSDYAELQTNVDYLHVWLSDGFNNHCECPECQKKIPSDWYIMLMNEIDEELTRRELDTRIVFICYLDTTWPPATVSVKNPKRFSLLLAAITRDYSKPVTPNLDFCKVELTEYKRNDVTLPKSVDEYLAYGKRWRDWCGVQSFVYEYHYWWPQFRDLGLFSLAKLIYDDIRGYKSNGLNGIVEDGSQRSFFPNGFSFYVYASTLFDTSVDFEELKRDYFSHAYGEDWRCVADFFEKLGEAVDYNYLVTPSAEGGAFKRPDIADKISSVKGIVADFKPFVDAHKNMPKRVETVMYRLLDKYLEYTLGVTEALALKALGKDTEALAAFETFKSAFGKYEVEMERCFDFFMSMNSLYRRIFKHINNSSTQSIFT